MAPSAISNFVPIGTYSGLSGLPLIAISHNSLYPRLILGPGELTIRVIRSKELRYDALARVTYRRLLGHHIGFVPKEGLRSFSAHFANIDAARQVLSHLAAAGAPLDERARALLAAG